ncbi:cytochrome c [Sphingomonas ginkgonis]|uniref:cytochrome c n=1 Tax=Sphingomonas ginkgonis TaxID=2315330 RepID=UPI001C8B2E66|nr:cytochrome c [Sphingomonas ginkgonis]
MLATRARRRGLPWWGWGLLLIALLFVVFLVWAHRPAIAAEAPPPAASFAPAEVAYGKDLAAVGNCISCHQAPGGGKPFAGGYGVVSPFGTIYGTNITPDPDTGIGRWSYLAFARAMREGVARNGSHLYPAFPYDHFSALQDRELRALYAYLMTRTPVRAENRTNGLFLPLRFRPFIAGWKLLFFRPAHWSPDAGQSAAWNRGAYLGEALAHCGGCHTPRGRLGQELKNKPFAGAFVEGWYAPPLGSTSPAVRAWTQPRLAEYLATGLSRSHAAAAGPMNAVPHNLATADPREVAALATYYARTLRDARASRAEPQLPDRAEAAARAHPLGAATFAGACAACHGEGAPMMVQDGRPALPLGSPLHEDNPADTIQIILKGLAPPLGRTGPIMPSFAASLTDAQVAELVGYMKARWGTGPDWPNLERAVGRARKGKAP